MEREAKRTGASKVVIDVFVLIAVLYFIGGMFGLPKWSVIFWPSLAVAIVAIIEIPLVMIRRRRDKRSQAQKPRSPL
jgi:hypothetical protein